MTGTVNMAMVKRKSLRPTSRFWGSINLCVWFDLIEGSSEFSRAGRLRAPSGVLRVCVVVADDPTHHHGTDVQGDELEHHGDRIREILLGMWCCW